MTKLVLRGGDTYSVLNQLGTDISGYEEMNFTPSGEFIGDLEQMNRMNYHNVGPYPYLRRNMSCHSKLLVPPLTNDIELLGIAPIPKDDIYLSFTMPKSENSQNLRIGIEEILLTHHKDWQEKRARTGRVDKETLQRLGHIVRESM